MREPDLQLNSAQEPTAMVAELCKMCTNALPDAIEVRAVFYRCPLSCHAGRKPRVTHALDLSTSQNMF